MGENNEYRASSERPIGADRSIDVAIEQGDTTPMTPPDKRRKWPLLVIILIIIGVVGGVVYYFVGVQSPKKLVDDPLAAATKFASPQALVDKVGPELKGSVMVASTTNSVGASDADGYGIYSPPFYRVPGTKFDSLPLKSNGTGYFGDSVSADKNYKALVSFFETNKFHKVSKNDGADGPTSSEEYSKYISYAVYESSNLLCAIRHTDASGTGLKAHISSIGCADKDSYAKAASKLQEFYTAYTDQDATPKTDLTFGFIAQGDGVDGYKYSIIYQRDPTQSQYTENTDDDSFTALYLKQPNSKEWLYWTGIQSDFAALSCTKYNDDVLKKSFNGFSCYDETTKKDSTVQ